MFTRQLLGGDPTKRTQIPDPAAPAYRLGDYSYGKEFVRIMALTKDGPLHRVKEFTVSSHLRLGSHKEYYDADNTDIIGSDVQESNMFVHARKHGIQTPEEYALSLTKHFLETYPIVMESNVIVEEMPWERLGERESIKTGGAYLNKPHNHAFVRTSVATRYCEVVRKRGDNTPLIISGITGLRVMKTAQAPFVGYVKGSLFTEGDQPDRVLCADIEAKWQYSTVVGIDFSTHWHKVRDLILQSFAGNPETGITTTSVQFIAYQAERAVMDAIPEICSISIALPNLPYLFYDFSRFPPCEAKNGTVICAPKDRPYGIGYAQLDRLNVETKDND